MAMQSGYPQDRARSPGGYLIGRGAGCEPYGCQERTHHDHVLCPPIDLRARTTVVEPHDSNAMHA
eukprot:2918920-Alexandrium_andersonii.AAC.1